jgi:hypothetical protein
MAAGSLEADPEDLDLSLVILDLGFMGGFIVSPVLPWEEESELRTPRCKVEPEPPAGVNCEAVIPPQWRRHPSQRQKAD